MRLLTQKRLIIILMVLAVYAVYGPAFGQHENPLDTVESGVQDSVEQQVTAVPDEQVAIHNEPATEAAPNEAEHDEEDARSEERRVGKECRSRWSP